MNDLDDFLDDDLEVASSQNENDEIESKQWKTLIGEIVKGNVIPVIGPDILIERTQNPHQLLVAKLASRVCKVPDKHSSDYLEQKKEREAELNKYAQRSFSQLIYDTKYVETLRNKETGDIERDLIYPRLNRAWESLQEKLEPSDLLNRIASIKYFPFIITTSFVPILEKAMKNAWGRDVNVKVFCNDPSNNADVDNEDDLRRPTVYYMFGRISENAHRYVVTDTDMLNFCKSWLSDNYRPQILSSILPGKYLLILGGNYPDWLFRFIWHSMKKPTDKVKPNSDMFVNTGAEKSLIDFLTRSSAFIQQKNPTDVITEIEKRLSAWEKTNEQHRFDMPQLNTDVFISYSRKDQKIANALYEALTAKGLNVWYDKKNITHGNRFMEEIQNAIESTRLFVPIISSSMKQERQDPHVYRMEWRLAETHAMKLARDFIYPLVSDGFDFYNADYVDRRIREIDATFYTAEQKNYEEIASFFVKKIESIIFNDND